MTEAAAGSSWRVEGKGPVITMMRIRWVFMAAACLALLGLLGCGMPSSWSVSPVAWGEEADGGVIVTISDGEETVEVGDDKENVPVLAHVYFFSEEDDDDIGGESRVVATTAALTDRTACTFNGEDMEASGFVNLLMEAQESGGSHKIKIVYQGDAATEIALDER